MFRKASHLPIIPSAPIPSSTVITGGTARQPPLFPGPIAKASSMLENLSARRSYLSSSVVSAEGGAESSVDSNGSAALYNGNNNNTPGVTTTTTPLNPLLAASADCGASSNYYQWMFSFFSVSSFSFSCLVVLLSSVVSYFISLYYFNK